MTGSALTVRAAMGRRDFSAARALLDRSLRDRGWRDEGHRRGQPRTSRSRRATRRPGRRLPAHAPPTGKTRMEQTMAYMELEFPRDPARSVGAAAAGTSATSNAGSRWRRAPGCRCMGLSRRRSGGWALAALGGMLVRRGASGHCDIYEALGITPPGPARILAGRCAARRHACRRERHDQSPDRGALPLLAQPREPAAVHAAPRVGRARSPTPCRTGGPAAPAARRSSGTPRSSTKCRTR